MKINSDALAVGDKIRANLGQDHTVIAIRNISGSTHPIEVTTQVLYNDGKNPEPRVTRMDGTEILVINEEDDDFGYDSFDDDYDPYRVDSHYHSD